MKSLYSFNPVISKRCCCKRILSTQLRNIYNYTLIVIVMLSFSGPLLSQCGVTSCDSEHQTLIDLNTLPICGTGSSNLIGDLQANQDDCQMGALNCHEFIFFRASGSVMQQFSLQVGQGAGCTGELDGSFSFINGTCDTLSNGGSNTTIMFTFPTDVDSIFLFFCLNSGAQISICDLCGVPEELPPCSLTFTCPPSDGGTFDCVGSVPPPNPDLINASNPCGPVTITFDDDIFGTGCGSDTMFISRTYIISDGTSIDSCNQLFKVIDNESPIFTSVAANITIACDATPVFGTAFATDNCDTDVAITFTTSSAPNANCAGGTTTRIFTATDNCGNTSSASQTLTYVDTQIPSFTFIPANTTVSCGTSVVFGVATATDNCDTEVDITHTTSSAPAANCAGGTTTRIWTATDNCGNTSSASQTMTYVDTQIPVFTFIPPNTTIACGSSVVFGIATATDICDTDVAIIHTTSSAPNANCAGGTTTRIFIATDNCGNSSTASQTMTYVDTQVPVFTFIPANTTIACGGTPVYGNATATDNCDTDVAITHTTSSAPNANCAGGTTTRMWTATDNCGNTSTASQTFTYVDTQIPVFTFIPANTTIACGTTPVFGIATATDICDTDVAITHTTSTAPNANCAGGTTTRIFTATDNCGNTSSASQTMTYVDTQIPVFTFIPANTTIACGTTAVFGTPTATDICDSDVAITHTTSGAPNANCAGGTTTRIWTATDNCGNTSSASQTMTYVDTQVPVFTFIPANTPIACGTAAVFGTPTASDICDTDVAITHTTSSAPNANCAGGTTTRIWTATDNCGNTSTASQTFTYVDTQLPVFTFIPANTTIACGTTAVFGTPTATDNCDTDVAMTHTTSGNPNANCAGGTTTRTWTATDNCGNTSSASQTMTYVDSQVPVFTFIPANTTISCGTTAVFGNATATDICDTDVAMTHTTSSAPNANCAGGTTTRTWTATDNCGNTSTASQTFTYVDTQVPVFSFIPANTTIACGTAAVFGTPTATDICDTDVAITHTTSSAPNANCAGGTTTRIWTATDNCGNTSSASQTMTYVDTQVPVFTFIPANTTIACGTTAVFGNATATDICDTDVALTHTTSSAPNANCAGGTTTRTWTATDNCGNTSSASQTLTYVDTQVPVFSFIPANATIACGTTPVFGNATATDICDTDVAMTHTTSSAPNANCAGGTTTRTWTATDNCGNTSSASQTMTYVDTQVPVFSFIPANTTIACGTTPVFGNATATDICDTDVAMTHTTSSNPNANCAGGTTTRTWTATDNCGNTATASQILTFVDNVAPDITFVDPLLVGVPIGETIEVQCFGQDPEFDLPAFDENSVSTTDNCTGDVDVDFDQQLLDEGDCANDGYIIRMQLTWTATDACGNSSSAFVFMELLDNIPPVIVGIPADITVSCDEIPELPTLIYATDECLCACVVLFNESIPEPGCQNGQVIVRTWTAEDDCGNQTVETQQITLMDNEGPEMVMMLPELAGLPDGTILEYSCNEGGIPDFFNSLNEGSVSNVSSCGAAGTMTFNEEIEEANNCEFRGFIENRIYTWKSVDQCNNPTTMSITARLMDTEAPWLVGVPDTTCMGDPSLSEIEVMDNCENASLKFWDVAIPNPCGSGTAMRRTYEGTDACGNTVRDTAILISNELDVPEMVFSNPVLAEMLPGQILEYNCQQQGTQYTPFGANDVSVSEGCGSGMNIIFEERMVTFGFCQDGAMATGELVWTATDVCGNSSQLIVPVNIVDLTGPEFVNFEGDITIGCNEEIPEMLVRDNCGTASTSFSDSIILSDCTYEYQVLRSYSSSDDCGNVTKKVQRIHVGNENGPVINGVIEEVCDDLSMPAVTAFDACAGEFVQVAMTEQVLDSLCSDGTVIERIWTATDICGNVATINQRIIMGDSIAPEIQIPSYSIIRKFLENEHNLVLLSDDVVMQSLNELGDNSVFVTDDCDQQMDVIFTVSVIHSDSCEVDGFSERRIYSYLATDICGNSDLIQFTVDIMDDVPPALLPPPNDTIIICGELPGVVSMLPGDSDELIVMDYTESLIPGNGPNEFLVIRQWLAADGCGNVTEATQNIVYIPTTLLECDILIPAEVECNSHGVVIGSDVSGGMSPFTYEWEITGDKCFIQSGQGTPQILIYVGFSEVEIVLTVTDTFGCSTVCNTTLDCEYSFADLQMALPQSISDESNEIQVKPTADTELRTDINFLQHLNLFPNPANESVNLSFESSVDQEVEFRLTNFLGQEAASDKIQAVKGYNSQMIDVSRIADGSYLMQVKSDKEMYTKVIVIVHKN